MTVQLLISTIDEMINLTNEEMKINIVVDNDVEKLVMDASEISTVDRIEGEKIGGMINFKVPLKKNIMGEYGKEMSQKEFRKIIDYVKKKSKWQDADFQTWRLILKRVLSSPAKTLDEFIQLEKIYESLIKE